MRILVPVFLSLFLATGCGDSAEGEVSVGYEVFHGSFDSVDDRDNGLVRDRTLAFEKIDEATSLRLAYFDSFAAKAPEGTPCVCEWEVRIDGQSCADPGSLFGQVVSIVEQTLVSQTITGWCEGVAPGDHTLEVNVSDASGVGCDCLTGFGGGAGLLEVEEF